MKIKNISILLFILVFSGIVLLGYTTVWAEIDLGDGTCSDQEKELNLCIEYCDYVIEVLFCEGKWPCLSDDGNSKAFWYKASTKNVPCDCPTWNYTVTQLSICEGASSVDYVTGSDPDGASLIIGNCKVSKCSEVTDPSFGICNEDYQLWKLNPTLNCSEGGSIDYVIYAPLDAGVSCGNPTWIRTRDGCQTPPPDELLLRGPGCDEMGINLQTIAMGKAGIEFDPCSGLPSAVTIEGEPAEEIKGWFCDGVCNPMESSDCVCYQATNIGPLSTGCLFRCNPDRYGFGGSLYSR